MTYDQARPDWVLKPLKTHFETMRLRVKDGFDVPVRMALREKDYFALLAATPRPPRFTPNLVMRVAAQPLGAYWEPDQKASDTASYWQFPVEQHELKEFRLYGPGGPVWIERA